MGDLTTTEPAVASLGWERVPLAAARSIIAALYDAAVLMTTELCVIDHNASYGAMTGLRGRRLRERVQKGTTPFDLIGELSGEDRRAAKTCIEERRGVHLAERQVKNFGGRKSIAWLSFIPVIDDEERVVAVVQILRDVTGESQAQAKLKELLALMKARAEDLERAVERRTSELSAALEDVTRLSRTDPLTGLLNRRAFSEMATQAIALAKRHDRCLAILMCDLDHFKKVNDEYGHQIGDALLLAVADALKSHVRESDTVARVGGEEFVVMLTETDPASVMDVAGRFNDVIRKIPICDVIPGAERPQTVSVGVAHYPDHGDNLDQLLTHADAAMYAAKQNGRDRAILFDPKLTQTSDPEVDRPKRVLVIDSDQPRLDERVRALKTTYDVLGAPTVAFAQTLVEQGQFDVIVCDERIGDQDGVEVLRRTLTPMPGALRIMMVETQDFFVAVRATNSARVDHFLLRTEAAENLAAAIEDGLVRRDALRDQMVSEQSLLRTAHVAGGRIVRAIVSSRAIDFAFQPIVAADGGGFGYEALCRPKAIQAINPSELFETAVRSGDIWRLGRLCREIVAGKIGHFPEDGTMFINLHPAEVEDPLLFSDADPLRPYAERVVFEITERASIHDFSHFRRKLAALKQLGFRFAVDDLGAGYASLSSVAMLEPDFLKIDMSIVRDLRPDTPRYGLVKRIVDFANDHGLLVVAEGIETSQEAESAREIGCHLLQGYLLGRPARVADFD